MRDRSCNALNCRGSRFSVSAMSRVAPGVVAQPGASHGAAVPALLQVGLKSSAASKSSSASLAWLSSSSCSRAAAAAGRRAACVQPLARIERLHGGGACSSGATFSIPSRRSSVCSRVGRAGAWASAGRGRQAASEERRRRPHAGTAAGRGPPAIQSSSSTVCTTGRPPPASWVRQPILPAATRSGLGRARCCPACARAAARRSPAAAGCRCRPSRSRDAPRPAPPP